jgi:aspartate/methionine/tyrosine aminotransferase
MRPGVLVAKRTFSSASKIASISEGMKKTRDYLDRGAPENSIILGSSNPVLSPPQSVLAAGSSAFYHGHDIYTGHREAQQNDGNTLRYYSSRSDRGISVLRDNLYKYLEHSGYNPEGLDFFVTTSILSSAAPSFLNATLNKGDKVLLTTPTYGPFFSNLRRREADIILRDLDRSTKYKLTPETLQSMLTETPDAKILFMINPGNPMGEVYSKEELEKLSKVIIEHNQARAEPLIVFSDEVARNITFSGKPFTSIGSIPGMEKYTYTCWSLSKDLGGPGVGFAVAIASKELIEKTRVDDVGPAYPIQYLAAKVFELENQANINDHCLRANGIYQKNIKLMTGIFEKMNYDLNQKFLGSTNQNYSNIIYPAFLPEGGFQMVFNVSGLRGLQLPNAYQMPHDKTSRTLESSLDFAEYVRSSALVEFIPGEGFGIDGKNMSLRMSIGKREEVLIKAFERIEDSVSKLTISERFEEVQEENCRSSKTIFKLAKDKEREL